MSFFFFPFLFVSQYDVVTAKTAPAQHQSVPYKNVSYAVWRRVGMAWQGKLRYGEVEA